MCQATHSHDHHGHNHEDHDHPHAQGLAHRHGPFGRPHVHGPVDNSVTARSLIALGVSGGLVPCPSALVVLLSAIALHRVGFGIVLIVAFSAGLATVLTAIGLLLVHARSFFARMPVHASLLQLVPVGSAALMTILGATIAAQSLVSGGVLHL